MIRHYRIDHLNGCEILVCEVYDRYLWNQQEIEAFNAWIESNYHDKDKPRDLRSEFRTELNEWCDVEHDSSDTFFGLREPIPVVSSMPCVVLRGFIVNGTIGSVQADRAQSITNNIFEDEFQKFVRFVINPHWRNTISHQFEQYGTLFASEGDS